METWDTYVPHKLGDTSADYAKWRAEVLQIRDLPEYKLRKLWKLNFSPKDIEQDKHWTIYPRYEPGKKRIAPGTAQDTKRGRTLSDRKKSWIYARALVEAAASIISFYRLEPAMLTQTRNELDSFKALMQKYAHKQKKKA